MSSIEKHDKNFFVDTSIDTSDLRIINSLENPIETYGLILPDENNDRYKRIPTDVARNTNDGVVLLHSNTAGGRIRFNTNARSIAIFAKYPFIGKMPHFALTGSVGFDLYVDNRYEKSFVPPFRINEGYCSRVALNSDDFKEITINFPLYSDISSLFIGIDNWAEIKAPAPYKIETPIVYYGSSITQGGCASRPGNSYQAIISRKLDCDYINLGFSGSAKGERSIAEYISCLKMSVFVYDYDHNAPTVEHLRDTHKNMFDIIRAKNPELPIVIVSKPRYYSDPDTEERFAVIKKTYDEAVASGDKNVYLINGGEMMREYCDDCGTVDTTHPNDHGFCAMAKGIGSVIERILMEK